MRGNNFVAGRNFRILNGIKYMGKGTTEDEIVGWHHQFNGHEFEQILGGSEEQGSLLCCNPWGHNDSDTAEQLN